ncbi:hypothetical protein EGW08_018069 [Elysia chlorotica]|uniref:Uncharacterized protein n=1 Tax=Elysia chlorotica TaxID=188477 RepID=A0A3S0ZSH4_ELYCH|nr:hypothetical protein EGW08_018069 [Elysia chlorotica]
MGNQSSAGGHAKIEKCQAVIAEAEMNTILIPAIILPQIGAVQHIHLGLVNSVEEEIERLVHKYDLKVPVDECQLVIVESDGKRTVMEPGLEVEHYVHKLTQSSHILHLDHIGPESPNAHVPELSKLGVALK